MTNIEWTDETWQVTHGCSKVAAGCANCYAIQDAHRMAGNPNPKISGPRQGLTKRVTLGGHPDRPVRRTEWTGVVRTAPENLGIHLRWKKPRKIFVNSNSDLFHEDVPFEYIAAVFGVMAACPQHTFQVLTKRPERALEFFEWCRTGDVPVQRCIRLATRISPNETRAFHTMMRCLFDAPPEWPLPNVEFGVSLSDQPTADKNVPLVLRIPAAVRFVSAEPLLGPVDLTCVRDPSRFPGCMYLDALRGHEVHEDDGNQYVQKGKLDWVIVGGESGPGARPCDVAWIRSIVQQCKAASARVFVKQLGAAPIERVLGGTDVPLTLRPVPLGLTDRKGGDPEEWPADLRVREFPEVTRG